MKQYKGYYLDNVIFNSEREIEAFIKKNMIEQYKMLCEMFAKDSCMELIEMIHPYEEKLHKEFGLSYEEIEQIEIEAYSA